MYELNESYEDYLKAIYSISKTNRGGWVSNSEIAKWMKVRPSSVTDMLYKLREKDLVDWKPRKALRLTQKGKEVAKYTIERYKSLRGFFVNVLKMKDDSLIKDLCCKIEHHLTPEISEALENLSV